MATLSLPSVIITSPTSTSITATEVGGAGSIHPGAPGTKIFNCVVNPATWTGAATVVDTHFAVANIVGNTFDVVIGPTAVAPGTYTPGATNSTP